MNIDEYIAGINANITNQVEPYSITAQTVGNGFTDLAAFVAANTAALTYTLGSLTDAPTIIWDCGTGFRKQVTIATVRSLSISNCSAGQSGILEVTHGSANSYINLSGYVDVSFGWGTVAGNVTLLQWYYNGTSFRWSSAVYGTPSNTTTTTTPTTPTTTSILTILSSTGVVKSGNSYSPANANGTNWGNTILFNQKIRQSTSGGVYATFNTGYKYGMLGIKTAQSEGGYATFKLGVWVDENKALQYLDNGSVINNQPYILSNNELYGIFKTNGNYTIKTSTDNGSTWAVKYTSTYSTDADSFIVADVRGDGVLINPNGINII